MFPNRKIITRMSLITAVIDFTITGSKKACIDKIENYIEKGVKHFVLFHYFSPNPDLASIFLFLVWIYGSPKKFFISSGKPGPSSQISILVIYFSSIPHSLTLFLFLNSHSPIYFE